MGLNFKHRHEWERNCECFGPCKHKFNHCINCGMRRAKSLFRNQCHICKRFTPKTRKCENEHNMESYDERMYAQAEADQDMMAEEALARAGGLDAVQEREREAYYVSRYGDY